MAAIIEPTNPRTHEPTFCALFNIANEHIVKDHGLLSWGMHEYYGYNSFMATYENGSYPNLKYIPGVNLEFIPRLKGKWRNDSCKWLRKNAKRIDVLFLYHFAADTFAQVFTYKFLNPKGKVYLKLDGWPVRKQSRFWKLPFHDWVTRHCKIISTEFEEHIDMLSREWHHSMVHVPNPSNPAEIGKFRPFSERSNIILTVGRLGTEQKATEILLEAFARISGQIPGWILKLAGRIEENMNIASDFYIKYPDLKERVIFTGEIRDRNTLIETYRDAKIFAFPSRHESFGIALTEAMLQGDFAVTSDIPSSRTLTENFRFALGSAVDDIDGLAKNLLYACTHEDEIEKLAIEGRNATIGRCDLKRVCSVIEEGLKS